MKQIDADKQASLDAPQGFTLWSTYPSFAAARMAQENYGAPDDVIAQVTNSGRWALYGRVAGS